MKKLIAAAAFAAMAGGVFADGAAPAKADASGGNAAPAAEAAKNGPNAAAAKRPARPAFDRAKFEARMKERQAERRAKVEELLKSAGVAADKVKALAEEIEKAYTARPQRNRRGAKAGAPNRRGPAEK